MTLKELTTFLLRKYGVIQPIIIDIDGTIADSSHRAIALPDGNIDLIHWRENSTPEKIALDKLLPLATYIKKLSLSETVIPIICTARVMGRADYDWLDANDISYAYIISRREGDTTPDATLKILALKNLAAKMGLSWKLFCAVSHGFDDNQSVLSVYKKHNINYTNAKFYNIEATA